MYYITDNNGYRMRDSNDRLFTCRDIDEVERVISFYFDMSYGDVFRVYDYDDNLIGSYSHDAETCETEFVEGEI